jgi:hypothetical protein
MIGHGLLDLGLGDGTGAAQRDAFPLNAQLAAAMICKFAIGEVIMDKSRKKLGFRFDNKSGDQDFTVDDLVDTSSNPIWSGFVQGNSYSPTIYCTPRTDGPQWGKVSVIGDNPKPDEPMVKDIRYEGDEFVYVP